MSKVPVCFIPKVKISSSGLAYTVYNNLAEHSFTPLEVEWVRFQLIDCSVEAVELADNYSLTVSFVNSFKCDIDGIGIAAIQKEFSKPLNVDDPGADVERMSNCLQAQHRQSLERVNK